MRPIELFQGTLWAIPLTFLMGCAVSQKVVIHLTNGETRTTDSFTVSDSTITIPPLRVRTDVTGGYYERRIDSCFSLSEVKELTLFLPSTPPAVRVAAGIVGAALGAWAGSGEGLGTKGGGFLDFSNALVMVPATVLGACVGPYIADELSLKTLHFHPAIAAERDSLRNLAQHPQ